MKTILAQRSLKRSIVLILLFAVTPSLGCRRFMGRRERAGGGQQHMGTGTVESIASDHKTVQINHEEIKDYMPAMSMSFIVRKPDLLDSINPGDRVDFTIRDHGSGYVLIAIRKR